MKNYLKILLFGFMFFIIFHIDTTAAFTPDMRPSGLKSCSYEINGNKSDGSIYNSGLTGPNYSICNTDIDFSTISDGVYDFSFNAYDNTVPSNVTTTSKTYKIDTKPVNCVLNTITLYGIDNQYYDNGKLYYKGVGGSGKFELNISCTDPGNNNYISNIEKINFPNLIGTYPKLNTNNFNTSSKSFTLISKTNSYTLFTLTYDWDTTNTVNDSKNILGDLKDFVYDHAGNSGSLVANNTKLIIRNFDDDGNGTPIKTINGITSLELNKDSLSPSLSTSIDYQSGNDGNGAYLSSSIGNTSRYFSALENRNIRIPTINDAGSGLRKTILKFEKYDQINNFDSIIYTGSTLNGNDKVVTFNQKIFSHDFRDVSNKLDYNNSGYRAYSWIIESYDNLNKKTNDYICDMVGNCTYVSTPDFRVVANQPILANSNHSFQDKYSGKVSDYKEKYNLDISFKDKYFNELVPVTGVKNITFTNNLDNTLGTDQILNPSSGNGVLFSFFDGNNNIISFNNDFHNYSKTLTQKSELDKGQLKIEVKSSVPTKNEYLTASDNPGEVNKSLYGDLSAVLKYNKFQIDVDTNNLLGYNGIGEYAPTTNSFVGKFPEFTFKPIINFDYIGNIYPLVEGQVKSMSIKNKVVNSTELDKFNLNIYVKTNNPYLQILDGKMVNGYISKSTWNNFYKHNNHKIKDKYQTTNYTSNSSFDFNGSDTLQILPKSLDGITNTNTKIGLYSELTYVTNGVTVKLPSIQTGLDKFGAHTSTNFMSDSSYENNSSISFAEIQITGITQTKNKGLDKNTAGSIVTDTAKTSFNDISKISLYDLKTNIKSNLNKYIKGSDLSKASAGNTPIIINDINSFDSSKGLLLKGGSMFYVKNRDVVINCGSNNPCKISGKKTIVVDGGNLTIKSDMYYDKAVANSILGLVVIGKNKDGFNGQVKIDENITNGVGVVYSEGPIVSVNSAGIKYDGTNVETNLKNQLYWKGSFATKNTVGGAIKFDSKTSCPFGTPEYEKSSCTTEIAQGYDLIYLRRYAVIKNGNNYTPINGPVQISGQVTFEENGTKNGGDANLTKSTNITSPLIIDYDSKLQSNPPYLFEKSK